MGGVIRTQVTNHPSVFAYVGIAGLFAIVPGLATPLLVRAFVDQYLAEGDTTWAVPVVAGLVAAAAASALLTGLQYRILSRLAVRMSAARPTAFVWRILRLPASRIASFGVADVTARASALQREAFQAGFIVPLSMSNLVSLLVFSVALLILDWKLGLTAMLVVTIGTGISYTTLRSRLVRLRHVDRALVSHEALTTEIIASIETIKVSAAEQWVFERWCRNRSELGIRVADLATASQRLSAIAPLTQTFGLGIVLAVGAWQVLAGSLTMGTLVASQSLLVGVLSRANFVTYLSVLLQSVASTTAQAAEVQDLPPDPEVTPVRNPVLPPYPRPQSLGMRSIGFGYGGDDPPLLDELNLDVRPGTTVALVGASGSGKSTIVRLTTGELQPWSGQVELSGVPRLRLPRHARTDSCGYVPQTPTVIAGTIRDNITLFDETIPQTQVLAAAQDACIAAAIEDRPLGYAERVSESDHGFSGGELQRLAIARALVRNPRILVLDEATSALDPIVEADVQNNLRRRKCTCLVVAHRLSAIRDADLILVLDHGKIVQRGRYADLRATGVFGELLDE